MCITVNLEEQFAAACLTRSTLTVTQTLENNGAVYRAASKRPPCKGVQGAEALTDAPGIMKQSVCCYGSCSAA